MHVMSEKDFKIFEQFVKMSQPALKRVMGRWLNEHYKKVVETKDYIYAEGDIPIALAAHLDTVFSKPVNDLFYDTKKNVMWSPDGLGADDRAGIFAIYEILNSGLRPHIILSTDEEKGCVGAAELSRLPCPFEKLNYIIQLDRRGTNDCVFYDCDNPEFVKYVEEFGFIEANGTYTDITCYCPAWGVAGVNLSVGYMHEHTYTELLYINALYSTIAKVKKMLKAENIPSFVYIPYVYPYDGRYWDWGMSTNGKVAGNISKSYANYRIIPCDNCGEKEFEEDMFPVLGLDGHEKLFCSECISTNDIEWCSKCYQAVERDPKVKPMGRKYLCPRCKDDGGKQ